MTDSPNDLNTLNELITENLIRILRSGDIKAADIAQAIRWHELMRADPTAQVDRMDELTQLAMRHGAADDPLEGITDDE